MGWLILPALVLTLTLVVLLLVVRRAELSWMNQKLGDLAEAKLKGSHRARLQYPFIDLSRCIGCGTCVQACPEDGVLDLIHGQAVVIHGARCVGHGLCAKACPVGAIDLTLGDLQDRRDIPSLNGQFESPQVPGLFLAGELTGYALIRTAITHGTAIADEVAVRIAQHPSRNGEQRSQGLPGRDGELLDLCIVGAGPAGLAASLQAKARGLRFITIEQEALGGTVAKYPRRKLAMTQPVTLPLHGALKQASYSKEELMELWSGLTRQYELPIRTGQEFTGVERSGSGEFIVKTRTGRFRCRYVCLALGRRGTPIKLNVPGEDLPKVAYSLIDAQSYRGRKILVVGGGDSAIEAALGLSEQPGNQVTVSYRKPAFFRLKARNEARLLAAQQAGRLAVLFESEVREITTASVRLEICKAGSPPLAQVLANDDVFILAGGTPPFTLLQECGVSFDPKDRPTPPPLVERGTGLVRALVAALLLAIAALLWVIAFQEYYRASQSLRPLSQWHDLLRPSSPLGLGCGLLATLLIAANLCYLVRRNLGEWIPGSLSAWMTSHVVTGILALLLVLIHASMSPRHTLGGHALAALGVLVITGAIGRYFYSFVPRAANGQELALEELNHQIAAEATDWDRLGRGFGDQTRQEIHDLVASGKWQGGFVERLVALLHAQSAVRETCRRLRQRGREQGLSDDQVHRLVVLANKAYRTALISAHYEDLRALLNSWRFLHRWVALLMVLLVAAHVWTALRYGRLWP